MAKPHFRRTADGQTMLVNDGLQNLTSGMGTSRDKGFGAQYTMPIDDPVQLLTAYKASRMIARAIDMPAEDSCREWREWQAGSKEISAIEAEEKRLGVQGHIFQSRRLARLFGGSALMIGTGEKDLTKPLNPERIGKGGLKYLTLLSRHSLSAGELDQDVTSQTYGGPKIWTLTTNTAPQVEIHPSRLGDVARCAALARWRVFVRHNGRMGRVCFARYAGRLEARGRGRSQRQFAAVRGKSGRSESGRPDEQSGAAWPRLRG